MVIGYRQEANERDILLEQLKFMCAITNGDDGMYEYYKDELLNNDYFEDDDKEIVEPIEAVVYEETYLPLDGPMDSAWPMKCHDLHHTGRSPYSTASNPDGVEKWRFVTAGGVDGSPVIGDDGVIYFGDKSYTENFYAVYPNGTLKWSNDVIEGWILSAPAIDEDGTLYVSSYDCYLYALNSDGSLKWKFHSGDSITSSPAIGYDGTIYFGNMENYDGRIYAINPNGTEKWHYDTGDRIASDPAIGDDGTIYIGSADGYLYAMNPNGTLKWRFETGDQVKSHPSIADDGTIYVGSFDGNTYAINPDGSEKWRFGNPGSGANSASIASDGTIYVAGTDIYALNPDGSLKWTFDFGSSRNAAHSSPAISADGTIYIGVFHEGGPGGEIVVVNPDGTEKWRKYISNMWEDSSPCIAEDGTVYIGSNSLEFIGGSNYHPMGYLHAFGPGTPNDPPNTPTIDGPTEGHYDDWYYYIFSAVDPEGQDVRFWIDWGDGDSEIWLGPANSGEELQYGHNWESQGIYNISVRAEDDRGLYSDWAYLEVTMPVNQQSYSFPLLQRFLERFPNMFPILRQLLGL